MAKGGKARAGRTESWVSIWSRRAISLPLYAMLAVVVLGGAPVWLLLALMTDVLVGQGRRLPRTRVLVFFAVYLGCELVGVAAATGLWWLTLGGRFGGAARFLRAHVALQRWWSGMLFAGSFRAFSLRLQIEGQELAAQGPFLLFVRHASTADTILAAGLVANPHRLVLRYVIKRELLWDPCLDIVGRRLPVAFIDRQAARQGAEVAAITRLAAELDADSAVLIYPEGTRFTPAKHARAVAALRRRGHEALAETADQFRHVLPPKLGGPLALLEAAPGVDVVLLEHTGFEAATSFASFWNGALVGQTIRVRLRRIPAADIPDHDRAQWLFDRWAEVDRWIDGGQAGKS